MNSDAAPFILQTIWCFDIDDFLLACFVAALVVLREHTAPHTSDAWPMAVRSIWTIDGSTPCTNDFSSWPYAGVRLMEGVLTGAEYFECTHGVAHPHVQGAFWLIGLLFAVLSQVPLLNMHKF